MAAGHFAAVFGHFQFRAHFPAVAGQRGRKFLSSLSLSNGGWLSMRLLLIRGDRQFMMKAAAQNSLTVQFATRELRGDPDFMVKVAAGQERRTRHGPDLKGIKNGQTKRDKSSQIRSSSKNRTHHHITKARQGRKGLQTPFFS